MIKCIWYYSKYLKKEGRRILIFSQELQKDKSFQMLSPAIYLEGWGKYFEHECIIKLSNNLIESWKTNKWWSQCSLGRSCPLSIESNAEFQSRVSLIKIFMNIFMKIVFMNILMNFFIHAWLYFTKIINFH